MPSDHPVSAEDESRVLKFRPRSSDALRDDGAPLVSDDEPDDFGHRMWTNAAAFAFTAALVAFGIWLAVSIADLRKSQDCVLMGRRDCAHLSGREAARAFADVDARRH